MNDYTTQREDLWVASEMVAFSSEVPLHIVSFVAKSETIQSLPFYIARSHQTRTQRSAAM